MTTHVIINMTDTDPLLGEHTNKICDGHTCKKKYCYHQLNNLGIYIYDNKSKKFIYKLRVSEYDPQKTYDNATYYKRTIVKGLRRKSHQLAVFFLIVFQDLKSKRKGRLHIQIITAHESIICGDTEYCLRTVR